MEVVRQKLQALELLLRQVEAVEGEKIAARFQYELAAARPQLSEGVKEDTRRKKLEFEYFEWKERECRTLLPRLVGLRSIEEMRRLQFDLTTVFNAYVEIKQELTSREQLLPIRKSVLELAPDDAEAEKLQEQEAEIEALTLLADRLSQRAHELAEAITLEASRIERI